MILKLNKFLLANLIRKLLQIHELDHSNLKKIVLILLTLHLKFLVKVTSRMKKKQRKT